MEKPFIKLFHTPNSGYFYDVGKNEIIRIPENTYLHLSEVMDGSAVLDQSDDEEVLEVIKSFKELGYLSSKRPRKIQHSATSMVPLLLDRCIDKITLQLTQDCNFRCKYCIYSEEKNLKQRSHMKKSISLETAKKAILFYRDHAVDSIMYNIGFYGGEPLLEWPLLKEVVLFAEKELMGKLLTFSITTNASLLIEPIVTFLDEHHINVAVSLDGIAEINDANRVYKSGIGTSDTVLHNLKMIKDTHPNLFSELRISSVIDPNIDASSFGIYPELLKELPLGHFLVNLEENTEQETILTEELYQKMEGDTLLAYLAEFGLYSKQVKPYGYNRVNNLHNPQNVLKPSVAIQDIMAPSGPCIPGKTQLLVTVDGDLYPCERVNETEANCIGNLESGFDLEKVQRILNIGTISESDCRNCWALRLCTSCIKQFDYTSDTAKKEKTNRCTSIMASAHERILGIITLYEFERYYKNRIMRRKEHES